MRALQVDAFTCCVGGQQDENVLILFERLLSFGTFLAAHPSMNRDQRFRCAEECAEPLGQVVQRVAVLAEDDHLAAVAVRVEHFGLVLED